MPFLSTASLFQPRSQQRMLLACALVSVVLHAALLALFPGSRDKKGSLQFLTATLARPAAVPALA